MALTKVPYVLIAKVDNNLPATTTMKGNAALQGQPVDVNHYGGAILWSITNGPSGPTAVPAITIQTSNDGVEWFDYHTVGGDNNNYNTTTRVGYTSGTIPLYKGYQKVRAIAYSSTGATTTNAVTVSVQLSLVTAV